MPSLEYIAGFFDGEGCTMNNRRGGYKYVLNVRIGNNNRDILDQIQNVIGGYICSRNAVKTNKIFYTLCLHTKGAYQFLISILPYLVVKKEEAEIALRFQESMKSIKCVSDIGIIKCISDIDLEFRERCHNEIKTLHGRKLITPMNIIS